MLFVLLRTTTYHFSGVKTIEVKTTRYEKLRYSVILTARVHKQVDGSKVVKLPPMIIFKNLQKAPKGKCPVGIVVEGTKGRKYDQRFDDEFIYSIVHKRPGSFFN